MTRYSVIFERDATSDLEDIRDYIANERGRDFAHSFVERIVQYCESFGDLPHRGTRRDEIRQGLRTVGWRRTLTVAFEIVENKRQVNILGVFYRGRDVFAALREMKD